MNGYKIRLPAEHTYQEHPYIASPKPYVCEWLNVNVGQRGHMWYIDPHASLDLLRVTIHIDNADHAALFKLTFG